MLRLLAFVRQNEMNCLVIINAENLLINAGFHLVLKICHFVKRAFLKDKTELSLKLFKFLLAK